MDPLAALAALAAAASEAKVIQDVEAPIDEPVAAYSSSIPRYEQLHVASSAPRSLYLDGPPVLQACPPASSHAFIDPDDCEPRPTLAKYMASLGKGNFCRARKPKAIKPKPVVETSLAAMRGPVLTPQLKTISDVSDSESSSIGRPKRKSAKAARNYLQRVMHNQFGDVQEERAQSQGSDSPTGNPRKRSLSPKPEDEVKKRKDVPTKKSTKHSAAKEKAEAKPKPARARIVSNESSKVSSPQSAEEKENASADDDSEDDPSDIDDVNDASHIDTDLLSEGSRVLVDYRNSFYKATVRKVRIKDDNHEYLIHYDGNKKSNVHWIPISKIRDVLKKEKAPTAKAKPKPKKKPAAIQKRVHQTSAREGSTEAETTDAVSSEPVTSNVTSSRKRSTSQRRAAQSIREKDGKATTATEDENRERNPKRSRKAAATQRQTSKRIVEDDIKSIPDASEEIEEEEEEFPAGTDVYVEYRQILYMATVMNKRQKKGATQFLVHYDGFKKASDSWMKESAIHKITSYSSRRFNKQRKEPPVTKQRAEPKKANPRSSKQRASYPRRNERIKETTTSDESESSEEESGTLDMSDMNAGVEFLPGSCVFVQWKNALYLAKMLKRRHRAGETEYLVHYNGFRDNSNAWIKLSNVYEINPKTRKIFGKKDTKQPKTKASEEAVQNSYARKRVSRSSSTASASDMDRIASGVPFLPGSTLFAKVKNGLHLAKMVKKRGDGDMMEYLVQYVNKKRYTDAWVPVSMVYEINAQTKRIFNKQSN